MAMDMGGHGMGMGGMSPPPPGATGGGMPMRKHYMHMTFYWGWKSEILFPGWPGARGGMYALALVAVFALALLLEFLGSRGLDSRLPARRRAAAGAARAAVHAVRMGVAYVLMLALMSFNVGVLLAAVAGHAAGYLAFRAGLCGGDGRAQVEDAGKEEAAPAACC